jgi:hypothetical protein
MREIFKRSANVVSEFADTVEHVSDAGADTIDEIPYGLNNIVQNWNSIHFILQPLGARLHSSGAVAAEHLRNAPRRLENAMHEASPAVWMDGAPRIADRPAPSGTA